MLLFPPPCSNQEQVRNWKCKRHFPTLHHIGATNMALVCASKSSTSVIVPLVSLRFYLHVTMLSPYRCSIILLCNGSSCFFFALLQFPEKFLKKQWFHQFRALSSNGDWLKNTWLTMIRILSMANHWRKTSLLLWTRTKLSALVHPQRLAYQRLSRHFKMNGILWC